MKIDASRVCREALRQRPTNNDLGAALLYAASKTYRKHSAQVGLAVLEMIEQYAVRFDKSRLEILAEFAGGKVSIEKTPTRFSTPSSPSPPECLATLVGPEAVKALDGAGTRMPPPQVLTKFLREKFGRTSDCAVACGAVAQPAGSDSARSAAD